MPKPEISAIICTHNRDNYLGAAIDSLLSQDFGADYEVLVVDNGSTDQTQSIVAPRLSHPRLQYVYEPTIGLSVARNTGATVAKAPILAYLDDDAEASPQWLRSLHQVYQAHPRVAIAGGRVSLLWPSDTPPPPWLSEQLAETLGLYDLGDGIQFIQTPGLTPRGVNYSIRRTFLEQMGGFEVRLGRMGTQLLSNEELYMTQQALAHEWQVVYVPEAIVAHNVAPERLHPTWFLKRSWWQGVSEGYREQLTVQQHQPRWKQGLERFVRGLYNTLRYSHHPAKRFDNLVYAYGQLGYLKTALRHVPLHSPNE